MLEYEFRQVQNDAALIDFECEYQRKLYVVCDSIMRNLLSAATIHKHINHANTKDSLDIILYTLNVAERSRCQLYQELFHEYY